MRLTDKDKIKELETLQKHKVLITYNTISTNKYLYFKDYGKTWALTKDELYKNIK